MRLPEARRRTAAPRLPPLQPLVPLGAALRREGGGGEGVRNQIIDRGHRRDWPKWHAHTHGRVCSIGVAGRAGIVRTAAASATSCLSSPFRSSSIRVRSLGVSGAPRRGGLHFRCVPRAPKKGVGRTAALPRHSDRRERVFARSNPMSKRPTLKEGESCWLSANGRLFTEREPFTGDRGGRDRRSHVRKDAKNGVLNELTGTRRSSRNARASRIGRRRVSCGHHPPLAPCAECKRQDIGGVRLRTKNGRAQGHPSPSHCHQDQTEWNPLPQGAACSAAPRAGGCGIGRKKRDTLIGERATRAEDRGRAATADDKEAIRDQPFSAGE